MDTSERDGALHVALSGELDIASVPDVESRLTEIEAGDAVERLVLDLTEVSYLDSTGLSMLINADRRARAAGRRLTVVSGTAVPRRILMTSGVDRLIEVVEQIEAQTRQ